MDLDTLSAQVAASPNVTGSGVLLVSGIAEMVGETNPRLATMLRAKAFDLATSVAHSTPEAKNVAPKPVPDVAEDHG